MTPRVTVTYMLMLVPFRCSAAFLAVCFLLLWCGIHLYPGVHMSTPRSPVSSTSHIFFLRCMHRPRCSSSAFYVSPLA
ncbi:hypothetical protein R3P38DRAFT_3000873 [Favolaschia claudopus]|uniref:Secreted peptide n=1 Tax=Favolaschia claudopus TaxID=2862362 RepID=A0AAW0A4E9_9AGAR